AFVVIIRYPADLQGEAAEGQDGQATAESKVMPEVPPMNVHVHIVMPVEVVVGHACAADVRSMFGLMADFDRALHDMSIDVADGAMAGAVHHGGPRGCAARPATVFGVDQGKGEQQSCQADSDPEAGFPSENRATDKVV